MYDVWDAEVVRLHDTGGEALLAAWGRYTQDRPEKRWRDQI